MTSGVNLEYAADGLRSGGVQAGAAAGLATGVAAGLRPVVCDPAVFGLVAGAGVLATAVLRARDAHVRTAGVVAAALADVQGRADRIATEGDGLTDRSTAIARQGR